MSVFVENLIALRSGKGYTQRQMARILGIAHSTYRDYELGKSEPGHSVTMRIAKELDISVDYLIGFTQNN